MNSAAASHASKEVCQPWKRDFGDPVPKAPEAGTGGAVVVVVRQVCSTALFSGLGPGFLLSFDLGGSLQS